MQANNKGGSRSGGLQSSGFRKTGGGGQSLSNSQKKGNQPKINTEEMEGFRAQLFQKEDFSEIPDEKLPLLNSYLRDYAQACASKEQYDDAERASYIAENAQKEYISRKSSSVKTRNVDVTEPDVSTFEQQCREEMRAFDENSESRINQLEKTHQEEKEKFEKKWREDMPQKYRKPSQRLLQLKQIEKSLASNGEYARAKAIHAEVDTLQTEELEIAQESIIRDYAYASQRLAERQLKDRETLINSRLHTRTLLETRQLAEKEAVMHRCKVIKTKQSEVPRIRPDIGGAPVTRSCSRKNDSKDDVLLPPLRPPNDPELVEETKQRQREANRKKIAYQKQNAAQTLARVSLGTTYEPTAEEENLSNSQPVATTKTQKKNVVVEEAPMKDEETGETEEIINIKEPKENDVVEPYGYKADENEPSKESNIDEEMKGLIKDTLLEAKEEKEKTEDIPQQEENPAENNEDQQTPIDDNGSKEA